MTKQKVFFILGALMAVASGYDGFSWYLVLAVAGGGIMGRNMERPLGVI